MKPDYSSLYETGKDVDSQTDPNAFGASFHELTTAIAWGGIWGREGLAMRDRSLIAIVVLAAMGRTGELGMHIPGGLRNGLTLEEIEEALIHMGLYAGLPATVAANKVAREALSKSAQK